MLYLYENLYDISVDLIICSNNREKKSIMPELIDYIIGQCKNNSPSYLK